MFKPVVKIQKTQEFDSFGFGFALFFRHIGRNANILKCREFRQQLVKLENKTNIFIPERSKGLPLVYLHRNHYNKSCRCQAYQGFRLSATMSFSRLRLLLQLKQLPILDFKIYAFRTFRSPNAFVIPIVLIICV